jgi:hypothetical protein
MTYRDIKEKALSLGYWFPKGDADFDCFFFGIRNSNRDQIQDLFDDIIGVCYIEDGVEKIEYYEGTTDPSLSELLNPTFDAAKKDGTAVVKEGQYRGCYTLGKHGTGAWRHIALVQIGPMDYYRDNDRDRIIDEVNVRRGNYATNLHAASHTIDLPKISGYSAGCQVVQNFRKHQKLMSIAQKQCNSGLGTTFTYTLFREDTNKLLIN